MNKGIIYLIQPAELIGTNRYKIGCSNKPNLDRCKNGYKNGSRYICIMECLNPVVLEKKIKDNFTEKFNLIAGNEYFEGNENEIYNMFIDIVGKHRNNNLYTIEQTSEQMSEQILYQNNINEIKEFFPLYKQDQEFDGKKQLIQIKIDQLNIVIKYIYMKKIKEITITRTNYINILIDKKIIKNYIIYDLNNNIFLDKINNIKTRIDLDILILDTDEDIKYNVYEIENNLIEAKIKNNFINNTIINNKIYCYTNDIGRKNICKYYYECIKENIKIIKNINLIFIKYNYYDSDYLLKYFPYCIDFNNDEICIMSLFNENPFIENKNWNRKYLYEINSSIRKDNFNFKDLKLNYEKLNKIVDDLNSLLFENKLLFCDENTTKSMNVFSTGYYY
jgi:hypothetical protein